MIPDQWYAVLPASELPQKAPLALQRFGKDLVIWRTDDGVACLDDRCVHRGAALSGGRVKEGCIECPFHGFLFDSAGACAYIPARGRAAPIPKGFNARTYLAREAHGWIWIYYTERKDVPTSLPALPWFEHIDDSFRSTTFASDLPVHYSRAVENQLDTFHVPFVHATTIGRPLMRHPWAQAIIDGPVVEWQSETIMRSYTRTRPDDGKGVFQPHFAKQPSDDALFLEFRFPNLWMNRMHSRIALVAVFAPVHETRTISYFRHYQAIMTWPVLGQLVDLSFFLFGRKIFREDERVVATQRPRKSELGMNERLIAADRMVIEYRRRRDALIRRAQESIAVAQVNGSDCAHG